MSKRKYLVTSALPYVNNVPHLGNIIGCVLSADVFARYLRLAGEEVVYICGTDEHGTATETKALEEGLTPREICDKYHALHKKIYDWFSIDFDYFGRTTSKTHFDMTQEIFHQIDKNGYFIEDEIEQPFCNTCDKFLADRFVIGSCPHCKYEHATGDQCENCGKLLNPSELVNPKCKIHGTTPTIKKSTHLFLNLEKLTPKLKDWADAQGIVGSWPVNVKTFTNAWFKDGLKPRCITRDLKWGVPVPKKGYENKVFYVWFDAPIGYMSFTKEFLPDKWKSLWTKDNNTEIYQFMAKDNIPFHTIIFPGILIAAGQDYNLVHHVNSTEYLNYENLQFSKSKKIGVFGDDAINSGIECDTWRYYLLMNRPENSDAHFTWEDLLDKTNNELIANLGNFINRSLVFTKKYFDGKVPKADDNAKDKNFRKEILDLVNEEYIPSLQEVKIKEGLKVIMHISRLGNQYFQENEPWRLAKEDMKRCAAAINVCDNLVKTLAILIEPYLPNTSKEVFNQLGIVPQKLSDITTLLMEENAIGEPMPLFRKLEEKEIITLKEKHSGKKEAFADIDLRVGKVIEAEMVKDSEKLIKLQIDFGNEKRQVLSGIRKWYEPKDLIGKNIINVHNLKPAKLAGELSQGMVLSCEHSGKLEVLDASKSKPGDKIFVEEFKGKDPKPQIEFKEFIAVKLIAKDGKIFADGRILKTEKEEISLKELKEGIVK